MQLLWRDRAPGLQLRRHLLLATRWQHVGMAVELGRKVADPALRLPALAAEDDLGLLEHQAVMGRLEHRIKPLQRILDGHGRPSDLDLLLDVADNISPGPYPVAADPSQGLDAVPFPPRQTTICPLGPSSVAPITSALRRFRSEFEAKITRRNSIAVSTEAFTAPADESVDELVGEAAGAEPLSGTGGRFDV